MRALSRTILAVAALVATADLARATTAGHLLKSAAPAADTNQDITGSIKKPSAADPDVTGSITKRRAKHVGGTGTVKPKPDSGH
jgi:hypothetical protein